jgi:hypothetical protein
VGSQSVLSETGSSSTMMQRFEGGWSGMLKRMSGATLNLETTRFAIA